MKCPACGHEFANPTDGGGASFTRTEGENMKRRTLTAEGNMTETEAIRTGGTLHSRSNPHLCALYAAKFTPTEAGDKLRYWREAERQACTPEWRQDCREHAEDFEAIIREQKPRGT